MTLLLNSFNSAFSVNDPNSQSYYAARYQSLASKLERIASFLRANGEHLSGACCRSLREEMMVLILDIKNFKAFLPGKAPLGECLINQYKGNEYSGSVLFSCSMSAWKIYTSPKALADPEDTFLKIFNSIYKKKYSDIVNEKINSINAFENKYKKQKLNELLKDAVRKTGYNGKIKRFNVMNQFKFVQTLEAIGAPNDYFSKAERIYEESHVVSNECRNQEKDELECKFSDSAAFNDYELAEKQIESLITAIDRLLNEAEARKDAAAYNNLIYYITLKARNYLVDGDTRLVLMLKGYIDEQLLDFAKRYDSDNDVEILAEYTGQQYDTARKKIRKVQNALLAIAA